MALFPWPSWSSLVLETLLRRPLFFFFLQARVLETERAQSWTGSIFSKALRKDQKVVVFRLSLYLFLWRGVISHFPGLCALAGALSLKALSPSRYY